MIPIDFSYTTWIEMSAFNWVLFKSPFHLLFYWVTLGWWTLQSTVWPTERRHAHNVFDNRQEMRSMEPARYLSHCCPGFAFNDILVSVFSWLWPWPWESRGVMYQVTIKTHSGRFPWYRRHIVTNLARVPRYWHWWKLNVASVRPCLYFPYCHHFPTVSY